MPYYTVVALIQWFSMNRKFISDLCVCKSGYCLAKKNRYIWFLVVPQHKISLQICDKKMWSLFIMLWFKMSKRLQGESSNCFITPACCWLFSCNSTPLSVLFLTRLFLYLHIASRFAAMCVCLFSVQRFFSARVQDDGSTQGIHHHRYVVTDNAVYIGDSHLTSKLS